MTIIYSEGQIHDSGKKPYFTISPGQQWAFGEESGYLSYYSMIYGGLGEFAKITNNTSVTIGGTAIDGGNMVVDIAGNYNNISVHTNMSGGTLFHVGGSYTTINFDLGTIVGGGKQFVFDTAAFDALGDYDTFTNRQFIKANDYVVHNGTEAAVKLSGNINSFSNFGGAVVDGGQYDKDVYVIGGKSGVSITNDGTLMQSGSTKVAMIYIDAGQAGGDTTITNIKDMHRTWSASGINWDSPIIQSVGNHVEHVVNTGSIVGGLVDLGGGNDTFANSGSITSGHLAVLYENDTPVIVGVGIDLGDGNDGYSNTGSGVYVAHGSPDAIKVGFVFGGDGNDKLTAQDGFNCFYGGAGNDTLVGGTDDDVLDGGLGNDSLTGGSGEDTFIFAHHMVGAGLTRITDFMEGKDKIDLEPDSFSGVAHDASSQHLLDPSAFHIGMVADDAAQRIIYNPSNGYLMYDPDGNGAKPAVVFAILENFKDIGSSLSYRDFHLYVDVPHI